MGVVNTSMLAFLLSGLIITASPPALSQPASVPQPIQTAQPSNDVCVGPAMGSFSNGAIALLFNFGRPDQNCEIIKDARLLNDLGYKEAAAQLMCGIPRVAAAMKAAGTPCEGVVRP